MGFAVMQKDGNFVPTRSVDINGRRYPVGKDTALSAIYYKVHHCGFHRNHQTRQASRDRRGTVHYVSPEAYFNYNHPAPHEGDHDRWRKKRDDFLASDRVWEWEERRYRIFANPDKWIAECRVRATKAAAWEPRPRRKILTGSGKEGGKCA